MQKLVLLACIVAAAAAQQHLLCNPNSAVTVGTSLTDFYLTTRSPNEAGFASGLTCEFNAESPNRAFFVEVKSFKVSSAVFTISSGDQVLFSGSSITDYQSNILTPSKSLKIRFDATGDTSNGEGVTVRVRALDTNGCIPGWTYLSLYDTCYGTDSFGTYLNYIDAQRSCNSMRSNLLHLPTSYFGTIGSFMRKLPSSLRSYYTWIGLTDRSIRYYHYWLSGSRQFSTSEISCYSGGSYSTCYSYERCGTFNDGSSLYAIFMDNCSDRNKFACSAPPGGTSRFYSVPNTGIVVETSRNLGWVWGVVISVLFVGGLITAGVYASVYSSRARARRMANGATSVVVSTGRVTVSPTVAGYPAAPQYTAPQAYPPYPTQQQYPQYSAAPPSYDAVTAGGQLNAGFNK